MGMKTVELVEMLVDQIESGGYRRRVAEENTADLVRRLTEAEGQVSHWRQAQKDAIAAGELMQAEIVSLRQQLAEAQAEIENTRFALGANQTEGIVMQRRWDEDRQQLDAAQAAVTLQRTRIERQRRVVDKVRQMLFKPNRDIEYGDINGLRAAIAELDGEQP